jgi:hypothetical protein
MKKIPWSVVGVLSVLVLAGFMALLLQKPRYVLVSRTEWPSRGSGGGGAVPLRWYLDLPKGLKFTSLKGSGSSDNDLVYHREISVDPWSLDSGTAKVKAYYRFEEVGKPAVEFRRDFDVPIGETGVTFNPAPGVDAVIKVKPR